MARQPIFHRPMTAAERKRRSREAQKDGHTLKHGHIIAESAESVGQSTRTLYYYKYIMEHSPYADLWKELMEKPYKLGISTIAEMVKVLPDDEQKNLIDIIKNDGKDVGIKVFRWYKDQNK